MPVASSVDPITGETVTSTATLDPTTGQYVSTETRTPPVDPSQLDVGASCEKMQYALPVSAAVAAIGAMVGMQVGKLGAAMSLGLGGAVGISTYLIFQQMGKDCAAPAAPVAGCGCGLGAAPMAMGPQAFKPMWAKY